MAMETSTSSQAQTSNGRRRPFSTWMKKLASFKGTSSSDTTQAATKHQSKSSSKKSNPSKNNNPYPESGRVNGNAAHTNGQRPYSPVPTGNTFSTSSLSRRRDSNHSSEDDNLPPAAGNRSAVATINTDIARSDAAHSHAPSSGQGTTNTMNGGHGNGRGPDSTFSSPAPSVRSLTTTLTTIHSAAPGTQTQSNTTTSNNPQAVHFSHQFPTSPLPTAIPPHLAPQSSGGHPSTYNTATANNLLTDNASILTLASSSKRRRRRSMDTDASVRALAPSSLWGGSRESLPLSVLSANIEPSSTTPTPHQTRPSGGFNDRASIYSTAGIAPVLAGDRNSYYAGKQVTATDGSSIKSGLMGHNRNDSITGSLVGVGAVGSPLASPRDVNPMTVGNLSRSNSGWAPDNELDKAEVAVEVENEHAKSDTKDEKKPSVE